MATRNETFFEALLSPKAAKWSAGVAFDRSNPLPLDQWSVFQSEAKATEYLTNAKAYPGQVIAYAEANGEMKVCVLSQNAEGTALTLKPVGVIPSGDAKTIEVSAAGAIALFGAATAANGTLPMIEEVEQEDGSKKSQLVWKTLEDIGAGDGNDNTTYAFNFANQKLTITPSLNGIAQTPVEIDLGTFITEDELQAAIEALPEDKNTTYELTQNGMTLTLTPSEGEADVVTIDAYNKKEIDDKFAALPEDKDTKYTAKADDKVLKLTGTEFSTELGLKHENGKISLTGIGGAVIAEFSDADFVADGVLQDVSYNAETKELTFIWNIITGTDGNGDYIYKTDIVNIADLIDTYTAGNGLQLTGSEFSIKLATDTEEFLSVDANGLKLSGVQTAINNAQAAAEGVAATKASEAQSAAEAKAAELATAAQTAAEAKAEELANAAKQAAIDDAATKYATTGALDAVSAVADAAVTTEEMGTYVASAISGKADKSELIDAYSKTEADAKIAEAVKPANDRLAELTTVESGAQVNKLENITVAEGAKISVSGIVNKAITIDDAALRQAITDADNKATNAGGVASEAKAAAEANALNIQSNLNQINALLEVDTQYSKDIAALQAHDAEHKGQYEALVGLVTEHGETLADWGSSKADTTNLNAAIERIAQNETDITGLGNTKLDKSVFEAHETTAANTYATKEALASEAETARAAEKANADAITAIYKAGEGDAAATGVLATEIARVEGLVSAEAQRADAAEKANADEIARVDAALKLAVENNTEGIDSIKELATWVNTHGAEAEGMVEAIEKNATDIAKNTGDIKAIYTPASGEGEEAVAASGVLVDEIARVESKIPGVDDKTIKLNDNNNVYVAEVSTDILVQGATTLVFYAGTASTII